jgi:hypothetical protein
MDTTEEILTVTIDNGVKKVAWRLDSFMFNLKTPEQKRCELEDMFTRALERLKE